MVYNTLKDTIAVADEELKKALTCAALENLTEDVKQKLFQNGILVRDDADERAILRFQYQAAKYSSDYISVLLLPTYACNLSCHYCPNPREPVFMSPETAGRVICFLKDLVQSTHLGILLKLYGGEPLLHADCCHTVCESLSHFCQSLHVPFLAAAMTNGTLLTKERTQKVLPYLKAIHVTLDGPQSFHNSIRHYSDGRGTYTDILDCLSMAREKGMRISIRVNVTPENVDSIGELLQDLKSRKFDEYTDLDIYFGPVAPLEDCTYFKDDMSLKKLKEDTYKLVPHLRQATADSGWKGKVRDIISDLRTVEKPELCQYQKAYHYVIDPHGKFYTCPAFLGDSTYCLGSLGEKGAEFTSLYYNIHTRDTTVLECGGCEYMPVCGGGCPVRAHMRYKSVDSYYCGSIKESTASRMLLYLQHTRPDLFGGELHGSH